MKMNDITNWMALPPILVVAFSLAACGGGKEAGGPAPGGGYNAEQAAEALYTVLKSDRKVYSTPS